MGNTHPDTEVLTYADWAKRLDPNGKVDKIVEILNQTNEILEDMLVREGNLPTGHRLTVRTGLPEAVWRRLNQGVPAGKSKTSMITEATGMLETYAEVDKALADLNGNTAAFRMSESRSFIEGMNQQMAYTLFHGSSLTPESFIGFNERYGSKKADNAENIIDAGGTGDALTSLWLIVWGAETIHGIFPKGSKAGLHHEDQGQVTLTDEKGGRFEGYRDHFKWDNGLAVRDWRQAVRIANIDLAKMSEVDLINHMIDAEERIHSLSMGRPAWYCNRRVRTALRKQVLNHKNVNLTQENVAGKILTAFNGVPLRRVDQLKPIEKQVK